MSWPPRKTTRTRGPVVPVVDVFTQLAQDDPELRRIETFFKLEQGDPISQLLAWRPTDEGDQMIKSYLLSFAAKVIAQHERARRARYPRRTR